MFKLLFSGWTVFLPILATLALLLRGQYLGGRRSRQQGRSVALRIRDARFCRRLVPGLPLLGLLGTVWGLIDTLQFMGTSGKQMAQGMPAIVARFAPALSSTLWGIIGALICMVFFESLIHNLEGSPNE
ncbi:MAG: hypothetical protein HN742_10765 [Lentisphaerae bacterium]|jgi:hypothetical protein|nr:hypothetical protein [Lentisphaerota bacterium]MBT4818311.1 hypothetical protein [Lentisphaerota bacterium]MBT5608909.1 hypothetical protein [Lentisphaerota bacterium]MBT7053501.1 hypothetical protein [Lentisphaerota bacterium]MBT7842345.1 hypothetical protein [Lentisphaerota bacterium]